MQEWLDSGIRIFLGAVAIMLVVKYSDRPWLTKWRSH